MVVILFSEDSDGWTRSWKKGGAGRNVSYWYWLRAPNLLQENKHLINCKIGSFFFFFIFFAIAGKWIESCDFCNNLSEQSVSRSRPTSLNSQTAQTEQQHDWQPFVPDKRFPLWGCCTKITALQCSNRGDGLLKRLSMEVKSGVSWCRPVLAPYLDAVYTKLTLTKVSAAKVAACTNSNPLKESDWEQESRVFTDSGVSNH